MPANEWRFVRYVRVVDGVVSDAIRVQRVGLRVKRPSGYVPWCKLGDRLRREALRKFPSEMSGGPLRRPLRRPPRVTGYVTANPDGSLSNVPAVAVNEYRPPTMVEVGALKQMALELCWEIEKLPPSTEQTALVIRASALHSKLHELLYYNCELRRAVEG